MSSGERDLGRLLASLSPELVDDEFVFATIKSNDWTTLGRLQPQATFRESEGLTLIVARHRADEHGVPYEVTFRCITLRVHSSLQAVGLTAAVATALAAHGISANVVAAYFHDHVFVPSGDADRALEVLRGLGP